MTQVNPSMRFTDDQMEAILDEVRDAAREQNFESPMQTGNDDEQQPTRKKKKSLNLAPTNNKNTTLSLFLQLLIEYAAHADSGGMKLSGLTAAYRDGVGNVSADLSALSLRAEEVLSFAAAASKKTSPSPPRKKRASLSPSPSPPPAAARSRQLAVRATATFKTHPSRSPSPVRRAAAALADVLALTSPEPCKARSDGSSRNDDLDEGASCGLGGLPQSPAIAEAFRAAGFAAGRPPTESEEGEGAAAEAAAAETAAVSPAAAATAAAKAAPLTRRRFWPPAAHAANSSPLRPPAMARPAATIAPAKEEEEKDVVPLSKQQQQQRSSSGAAVAAAAAIASRAVRFDLSAYETPPPQVRKRHDERGTGENESGKRKAAAADNGDGDDRDDGQSASPSSSSDAADAACIASLMSQGQAAASAGKHAAAAAAFGSAGRCSSRGRGRSGDGGAARDPLTPAPRPRVCSRALFRLGNSLFAMGQPAAAEAAYLEALRVMDEDLPGGGGDDGGKSSEAAEEEERGGDQTSAADARLATSLRVNLGIALEAQGMLAAAADQYAAAAAAADGLAESERLKREKRSSAVSVAAAAEKPLPLHHPALFALGRPAAARDALQRALSLDPSYADAHCDLGCCLCALGDASGAAAAFSAALRASEGDDAGPHREALFNLANLRRQTGDFTAAVCGYNRVLALDPGHWRAHLGRAVALLGSRRDGDARGALRIAFALSGIDPSALDAELRMLREAAAAPDPERATLAAAMAAVAERASAEVAAAKRE